MALGRTGVVAITLGATAMLSPRAAPRPAPHPPAAAASVDAADAGALPDAGGVQAPSPEVLRLRQLACDARAPVADRARAAFALAQAQGPAAVADLEPLLQDPSESLRVGAARGLGQAGGDDAKKALEDRLEQEEAPVVREAIQRTLTLMQP